MLPAILPEGTEAVDGAGRADDQQVEESVLPDSGAEAQVDVEDEGNASSEGVQSRELPSSYMPMLSEIRQHKTTHVSYRRWCDECVSRHLPESGRTFTERFRMGGQAQ